LNTDKERERRERDRLERDDARAGDAEYRSGCIYLRHALVMLSPQKSRVFAQENMARHQTFDRLVGIEEAIAVNQKRKSGGDRQRCKQDNWKETAMTIAPAR